MAYIGNIPADKYQTLQKQSFTTSATDTYTLSYAVSNPQDLALFINNVRQNPNDAYTVSNTTLTLSSAITGSDTMYAVFLGRAVETVAPALSSVTNDMLAGSIANAKLANSSITLNGSAVSLGGSATVGGNNTPSFMALKTSDQSVSANTSTIVTFNSEIFDSDGKYDTSTSKFTPTVAGKYLLFAQLNIKSIHDQATTEFDFKKNGSNVMGRYKHIALNSSSDRNPSLHSSIIVDADADDYFQIVTFTDFGSGTTITGDSAGFTYFGGFKLIGA